jgi:hypothetical protein
MYLIPDLAGYPAGKISYLSKSGRYRVSGQISGEGRYRIFGRIFLLEFKGFKKMN